MIIVNNKQILDFSCVAVFSNSRQCYFTLCCADCSFYVFETAVSFCAQVNWKSHEIHIFAILTVGKGLFSTLHADCTLYSVQCTVLHSEDLLRGNDATRQKKTTVKTGKMM